MPVPAFEKKLITWLEKHMDIILLIVLSAIAFGVRFMLSRLHAQVPGTGSDTRITMMFDLAAAIAAAALASSVSEKDGRWKGFLAYMVVLISVGNVFASAVYGRWDSLWAACAVTAVMFLIKEKNLPAFAALAIACALSSYALMLIPFFFFVYIYKGKFSVLCFILPFAAAAGRLLSGVNVGLWLPEGVREERMYEAFPSFWGFISTSSSAEFIHYMPIALVVAFAASAAFFMTACRKRFSYDKKGLLWTAFLSSFIVIMFLPGMGAGATAVCFVLAWILALSDAVLIIPALLLELLRIWPQAAEIYGSEWMPFSIQSLCWIQTGLLVFYLLYFYKKVLDSEEQV